MRSGPGAQWRRLAAELAAAGYSYVQIAQVLRQRYGVSALVAMRQAHGWSQVQAAAAWCARWPDDLRTYKAFLYWETWQRRPGRHGPSLPVLDRLAQLYGCRVADLLADAGDYRTHNQVVDVNPQIKQQIDQAITRSQLLEREVNVRWPGLWHRLDELRTTSAQRWPAWCLLPSAAVATAAGWATGYPAPVAALTALYTWRYSRTIYVYERARASVVMRRPPDDLTDRDPLTVLPDWCTYTAGGHRQWPGAGMWAHLDADHTTGTPILRLLVDLGDGGLQDLVPIPLRLDRHVLQSVADQHGGTYNAKAARLAEVVDRLIALATYPTHPDTTVQPTNPGEARPAFSDHPVTEPAIWTAGFGS